MEYIVGIDGGGTKTEAVLVRPDGEVLASGRVGAANYQLTGPEGLRRTVERLVGDLLRAVGGGEVSVLCAGLAGVDRLQDRTEVALVLKGIGEEVAVASDGEVALEGAHLGGSGIVVIAGTGSIAWGRDGGRVARAGGWGYLLGDEGGGYWIGKEGIVAALKAWDGRGPETSLRERLQDHLRLPQLDQIVRWAYREGVRPDRIAGLARVVFDAADAGDRTAAEILHKAGRHLGKLALAVAHRLGMGKGMRVALIGGMFGRRDWLLPPMEEVLKDLYPAFSEPLLPPSLGAALLGLRRAGEVPDAAVQNLLRGKDKVDG
ncbi:MAG TPA: hypothetical protein EYP17_07555 [Candidatus Latescibacteria bacterium]|nr:hypothetical protein [Candidatus Latescibacterota bacterium]